MCNCCSVPDTETALCRACPMKNRFPLSVPQVALEVTATDFLPVTLREGQGCTEACGDGVEAGCEGLLTQGPASKDKCFQGA